MIERKPFKVYGADDQKWSTRGMAFSENCKVGALSGHSLQLQGNYTILHNKYGKLWFLKKACQQRLQHEICKISMQGPPGNVTRSLSMWFGFTSKHRRNAFAWGANIRSRGIDLSDFFRSSYMCDLICCIRERTRTTHKIIYALAHKDATNTALAGTAMFCAAWETG